MNTIKGTKNKMLPLLKNVAKKGVNITTKPKHQNFFKPQTNRVHYPIFTMEEAEGPSETLVLS
jgi:hypothetical protein